MYLSKLEIFGFKSFANKTQLILNDGITAIVGPNGCGKTNIVDALRWSLGEQRYSTLRSDKMEDVIFNGTKNRKPINISEVSLTIENNRGILPLDFNEVTVTRRLFRSGDSEYLLNNTACRLKDIVGLFMDTGMGANAYSVIELKMVETILSDKMEERRKLFEEAAGVTRYKARRREALRKLADVEHDLLRVDDIVAEVSKTVNSLNRQARKAERYSEFLERQRVLEIDVLQRDYTTMFLRLEPLEQRLSSAITERDGMTEHLTHDENLLHVFRGEEREIEEQLQSKRSDFSSHVDRLNESEQKLLVNEERKRSLLENVDTLGSAKSDYEKRIGTMRTTREELTRKLDLFASEQAKLEQESAALRDAYLGLEQELSGKKLEAESRQNSRMQLLKEISVQENEGEMLRTRRTSIDEQVEILQAEEDDATGNLETLGRKLEEEDRGQEALSGTVLAAEREFREMEERKQQVREEIDQLQNRAFEIQGQIGEKMTKSDFLNGLVDRLEGYNDSVQHLLRNRDWTTTRYGTIADAINTKENLRISIEAALGDAAHYLLVNDVNDAISGLQNLKEYDKGKATFACLARIPEAAQENFPIAGDGVVGWAIDMVEFETQHYDLFHLLLQKVLIVRDAEVAHRSTAEYPGIRCVTLAGDIFDSNGLVRGGSHGKEEGSLIGKRDQIASLKKEVDSLKQQLAENQEVLEDKNLDYNDIDLKQYADRITLTQQNLSAHGRAVAQLRFEIEKFERVQYKNSEERERLGTERREIETRLGEIEPLINNLQTQQAEVEENVRTGNEILSALEEEYNAGKERFNKSNLAVVEKRGEIQNLRNEFERLGTSLVQTEEALEQSSSDIIRSSSEAANLTEEIDGLREELEVLKKGKTSFENDLSLIEKELAAKREEADRIETALQDERQKHSQTINLVHENEMKIGEIKQRIVSLEERARNDFEMELQRLEIEEEDVFDLAQARDEINNLQTKIRALGLVNPLAFEEWKEEKERLDLLTSQRQDLTESRQTLNDTIHEINETAKLKFNETFGKVRDNFNKIFKSLFDEGDDADLLLEEHEDPLEARIEIIAKPRGKRPQSIDLLSGGEKTLTAIALLFAIYLVKPSPFCILDEVDAPLDDANIDRFIGILRDFSDNTQFIVVTHNKRTMAAADTLYGVTMEEEGVSKLVAVDFTKDSVTQYIQN